MQNDNLNNPLKSITDKLLSQINSSEDSVSKVEQRSLKRIEEIEKLLLALKKEVAMIIDKHSRRQRDYQEEKKRLIKFTKLYKEDPIKNEALYFKVYQEADSVKKEMLELEIKESSLKERRSLLEQEYRDMEKISKDANIVKESINMAKVALSGEFFEIKKEIKEKDLRIDSLVLEIEKMKETNIENLKDVSIKSEAIIVDFFSNSIEIIETAKDSLTYNNIKKSQEIIDSIRENFEIGKNLLTTNGLDAFSTEKEIDVIKGIDSLINKYKSEKLEIILKSDKDEIFISRNNFVHISMLIEEALKNAKSHSNATEIIIIIEKASKFLNISVCDNGKGFDCSKVIPSLINSKKFGIINMKNICQRQSGKFFVKSDNSGTKFIFNLPIK